VKEFLDQKLGSRHKYISKDGKYIYHLGIIDPLQAWDMDKIVERYAKIILLRKNGKNLSAVEPNFFAKRWLTFMN
jgi:hypothetical protein